MEKPSVQTPSITSHAISDNSNQNPTIDPNTTIDLPSINIRRIAKGFLYGFLSISMIGLFGLIWGTIWAIGDLFSEDKFAAFLRAPLQAKFFWIGLVIIGWGFEIIFLFLFYHKEKPVLIAKINESVGIYSSFTLSPPRLLRVLIWILIGGSCGVLLGILMGTGELFLFNLILESGGMMGFFMNLSGGLRIMGVSLVLLGISGCFYLLFLMITKFQVHLFKKVYRLNQNAYPKFTSINTEIPSKGFAVLIFCVELILLVMLNFILFGIGWLGYSLYQEYYGSSFSRFPLGYQISSGIFGGLLFFISFYFLYAFHSKVSKKLYEILFTQVIKVPSNSPKPIQIGAKILLTGGIFLLVSGYMSAISFIAANPRITGTLIKYAETAGPAALLIQLITLFFLICIGMVSLFLWNNACSLCEVIILRSLNTLKKIKIKIKKK